jgi:hypothetical protein
MITSRRRFLRYLFGGGVAGAAACYPVFMEASMFVISLPPTT